MNPDTGVLPEAVAQRVVELLAERAEVPAGMLSVAEFARAYGRSTDYVREHAQELGGVLQPSTGTRRLWRFPPDATRQQPRAASPGPALTSPRRRARPAVDLLRIRGPRP